MGKHLQARRRLRTDTFSFMEKPATRTGTVLGHIRSSDRSVNVPQNRSTTASTMTTIRSVGTSFIIRYCRPVKVLRDARKSFRRLASQ